VTTVDWFALLFVLLTGLVGLRKGLIASFLSVVGIVAGALLGARLAPHLLPDGARSPYTPLVALGGAVVLAAVLEALASMAGSIIRRGLHFRPLRALDSAGGLVLGAVAGLAVIWVAGAAALLLPGQRELRRTAQQSAVLRRLDQIVAPSALLHALARVDPFPSIAGPAPPTKPPTAAILREPAVRAAAPSVVRVLGSACGLGIAGTGWVVEPGLVVTAAHVVAGEQDTVVQPPGSDGRLEATAVAFDSTNDVAVLRVPGLIASPLPLAVPVPDAPVAILGYPDNGPLTAIPGRMGRTASVLTEDAYGNGPVTRTVTSIAGAVRHGDSGGPAVDRLGRVQAMMFAVRVGTPSGYATPSEVVRNVVASASGSVSTGPCAP
jgi:uncharacterized membrane protein required for colicin V production